jgi:RNA recognition motif-containing protein
LLTNANQVQTLFESYGRVLRAGIMRSHHTGSSLGVAYVLMSNDREGNEAIQKLNGANLDGRPMDVQEAFPPERNKNESRFHAMELRSR